MKLFSANKSFLGRYDRMLPAYAVTLLVVMCGLVGFSAATGAAGNGVDEAQMVLDNMLRAQENLTSFELPATARVYLGGRNVLTANVQVLASRPNNLAVKWLGVTIRPRKGIIFIDPAQFVSENYTLSVLARPSTARQPSVTPRFEDGHSNDGWVISAISRPGTASPLRWKLYVDPETWLIVRAEVITADSDTCIIKAKYRNAGYRRWEPLFVHAEGKMVLEEFLPDVLVGLIMGQAAREKSAYVDLDFSDGRSKKA